MASAGTLVPGAQRWGWGGPLPAGHKRKGNPVTWPSALPAALAGRLTPWGKAGARGCGSDSRTGRRLHQGAPQHTHADAPAELLVGQHEAFQPYRELHVAAPHHVLNLEVQELGWEPQLLHHAGILSCCQSGLLFAREREREEVRTRAVRKAPRRQRFPFYTDTGAFSPDGPRVRNPSQKRYFDE